MTRISRRGALKSLAGVAASGAFPFVSSPLRAQNNPIRIAVICPLSGAKQPVGSPVLIGAEIARDQINAAGGVGGRMIELVTRDDKGDPVQSIGAARELVGAGANLIVGVPLTSTALALAGIIESIDGVYISTGTQDETLTHERFTRHYFSANENGITRQRGMARLLAEKYPDVRKWTAIIPDISIGHGSWNRMSIGLTESYKQLYGKDVEIIDPILTKLGSTDFKSQIVRLLSSPAEGLHNVLFGSDGITFFQQANQLQLPQKFGVISEQSIDIDLPKTLQGAIPKNIWSSSFWYHGAFPDNQVSKDLAEAYTKKTNDKNPHAFAALSHTGVHAYAKAIAAAGGKTDSKSVIDALENLPLDTAKGKSFFRKEDHQIITWGSAFNVTPTSTNPQGWEIKNFAAIDLAKITNPPEPGQPFKI